MLVEREKCHFPSPPACTEEQHYICVYIMYMQIIITTSNLAVLGIRWGLTPDDIYLWMLGQSHCKLFREASRSQRWVTELQFTDQHLRLSPLAQLDTHTHPCVNLSETNGGEVGRMCSASKGDLSQHPVNACHHSDCTDQAVKFLTLWHLFIHAPICIDVFMHMSIFEYTEDISCKFKLYSGSHENSCKWLFNFTLMQPMGGILLIMKFYFHDSSSTCCYHFGKYSAAVSERIDTTLNLELQPREY